MQLPLAIVLAFVGTSLCVLASEPNLDIPQAKPPNHAHGVVYLFRHGEKVVSSHASKHGGAKLTVRGQERAFNLVNLFVPAEYKHPDCRHTKSKHRFHLPKKLIASKYEHHHCRRTGATLKPLADCIRIHIDCSVPTYDHHKAAKHILESLPGPVAVSWEHKNIRGLAHRLGAHGVPHWESDDYDSVYVFHYRHGKLVKFTTTRQHYHPPTPANFVKVTAPLPVNDHYDTCAKKSLAYCKAKCSLTNCGGFHYPVGSGQAELYVRKKAAVTVTV